MSCCGFQNGTGRQVMSQKILPLDNMVLDTTFKMRYHSDNWKFEVHALGDGCRCFGACDKDCSLKVTYSNPTTRWDGCYSYVKVQWDDLLYDLKPGYYRLQIMDGDCKCSEHKIKIGKRCGPVTTTDSKRGPEKDCKPIKRQFKFCCDPCPPKRKPLGPCESWYAQCSFEAYKEPLPIYHMDQRC